jgi:hypothetical protein
MKVLIASTRDRPISIRCLRLDASRPPRAMTSPFYRAALCAAASRYWNKLRRLSRGAEFDLRYFDLRDFEAVATELKSISPGLDWLRVATERAFVDTVPAQHKGLQRF